MHVRLLLKTQTATHSTFVTGSATVIHTLRFKVSRNRISPCWIAKGKVCTCGMQIPTSDTKHVLTRVVGLGMQECQIAQPKPGACKRQVIACGCVYRVTCMPRMHAKQAKPCGKEPAAEPQLSSALGFGQTEHKRCNGICQLGQDSVILSCVLKTVFWPVRSGLNPLPPEIVMCQ